MPRAAWLVGNEGGQRPWRHASGAVRSCQREGWYLPGDGYSPVQGIRIHPRNLAWHADGLRPLAGAGPGPTDKGEKVRGGVMPSNPYDLDRAEDAVGDEIKRIPRRAAYARRTRGARVPRAAARRARCSARGRRDTFVMRPVSLAGGRGRVLMNALPLKGLLGPSMTARDPTRSLNALTTCSGVERSVAGCFARR